MEEVGHLGNQLGGGWKEEGTEGTETPRREGQRGVEGERHWDSLFCDLSTQLIHSPWEGCPWLELFLLSDPGI